MTFPLRVSENKRYLVDSLGAPFFLSGDSPWEISWQLTADDAALYLEARHQQGFNAILVDAIPYTEWSDHLTQGNCSRHAPFRTPGDFSTPNDAYFDELERLVDVAASKGMLVLLSVADLGATVINHPEWNARGGMWHTQYLANGPHTMGAYARYLGTRFRTHPNIIWVVGGDRDPYGVFWHVDEMARGLRDTAPDRLITYHAGAKSSGLFFQDQPWFDINMAYGYRDPHIFVADEYRRQPVKPTFLGESGYEGETLDGRGGSSQRMRRQAYWSILSGACGHFYGSAAWTMTPIWREWLNAPGSAHMSYVATFFRSFEWHRLIPDYGQSVIVDGYESGSTLATTATIPDGSLAISYLPTPRRVLVDLSRFKGPVQARWFDPTTGDEKPVAGSPFTNSGSHAMTPPEKNAAGDGDVVLVLSVA